MMLDSPIFPEGSSTTPLFPDCVDCSSTPKGVSKIDVGAVKEPVDDQSPLDRIIAAPACRNPSVLEVVLYGLKSTKAEKKDAVLDILALSTEGQLRGYIQETLDFLRYVSSTEESDEVCFFALRHCLVCNPAVAMSAISDGGEGLACLFLGPEFRQEKACDLLLIMLRLSDKLREIDRSLGDREIQNFLGIVSIILGINDYRQLRPHRLRDWVIRFWQEVPSTVRTQPNDAGNVFDLSLNWIGQCDSSMENKLIIFKYIGSVLSEPPWLRSSVRVSQNSYWAMNWLIHIITDYIWIGKELSEDIQFVFGLFGPASTQQAILVTIISSMKPSLDKLIKIWMALVALATQPKPTPTNLLRVVASEAVEEHHEAPLYHFLHVFISVILSLSIESFDSLSFVELALRLALSKASSPANAEDAVALISYLVYTSPQPLCEHPNCVELVRSLLPFFDRFLSVAEVAGTLRPKLISDTSALLQNLVKIRPTTSSGDLSEHALKFQDRQEIRKWNGTDSETVVIVIGKNQSDSGLELWDRNGHITCSGNAQPSLDAWSLQRGDGLPLDSKCAVPNSRKRGVWKNNDEVSMRQPPTPEYVYCHPVSKEYPALNDQAMNTRYMEPNLSQTGYLIQGGYCAYDSQRTMIGTQNNTYILGETPILKNCSVDWFNRSPIPTFSSIDWVNPPPPDEIRRPICSMKLPLVMDPLGPISPSVVLRRNAKPPGLKNLGNSKNDL